LKLTSIPNDKPQVRVEEEERQIHAEHEGERECGLVATERVAKEFVVARLHFHADHHSDRVLE
jgi:hypothetical protein